MNAIARFAALSCAMFLAACAMTPRVGQRDIDIRASSGEPSMAIQLPEGMRWFYSGGPFGAPTYAVEFNAERVATQVRIALNDDAAQQIEVGDASESVLRRIGPPLQKIRFNNLRQTAWDYHYHDTWGYLVEFSVMIDDNGLVAGKMSRRLNQDRDNK